MLVYFRLRRALLTCTAIDDNDSMKSPESPVKDVRKDLEYDMNYFT